MCVWTERKSASFYFCRRGVVTLGEGKGGDVTYGAPNILEVKRLAKKENGVIVHKSARRPAVSAATRCERAVADLARRRRAARESRRRRRGQAPTQCSAGLSTQLIPDGVVALLAHVRDASAGHADARGY